LEVKARHVFVAGDIAELVLDWSLYGTGPDGAHVHLGGSASDVVRRGRASQRVKPAARSARVSASVSARSPAREPRPQPPSQRSSAGGRRSAPPTAPTPRCAWARHGCRDPQDVVAGATSVPRDVLLRGCSRLLRDLRGFERR
jgi:hypothetical protein